MQECGTLMYIDQSDFTVLSLFPFPFLLNLHFECRHFQYLNDTFNDLILNRFA